MAWLKTISSWAAFYGVFLMIGFFIYSCARLMQAKARFWNQRAATEKKRTNIVVESE